MDEAYQIFDYLPVRFKNENETEYINFLWSSFESNHEKGNYQFAVIAYHMLFMSFIYFKVWQIKNNTSANFENSLIGFADKIEKSFMEATSPFSFSEEQEARIFLFFKLIGIGPERIGKYKKLVKDRNEIAHSNGNVFYKSEDDLFDKVIEYNKMIAEIQIYSNALIQNCYSCFLKESANVEEREYLEREYQLKEALIYRHYLSKADIKYCYSYEIEQHNDNPDYAEIKNLHILLQEEYSDVIMEE